MATSAKSHGSVIPGGGEQRFELQWVNPSVGDSAGPRGGGRARRGVLQMPSMTQVR